MWRGLLALFLLGAAAAAGANETHVACKEPGTIPDPEDASSLLVCANHGRLVVRVRCPEGLVASLSTATCEEPGAVKRRRRRQAAATASASTAGAGGGGAGGNGGGAAAGAAAMSMSAGPFFGGAPSASGAVTLSGSAGGSAGGSGAGGGVCSAGPGARCRDCDTLVLCGVEGGRARELASVSCAAAGGACDPVMHACVEGAGACGAAGGGSAFQCLQEGSFPDPYDCRRYHLCIGPALTHYSDTCQLAYDPDKSLCAKDGAPCDNKDEAPPPCASAATPPAAFPNHRAFYRVCLPRTPAPGARVAVLRCPDLQTFDPTTASCKYSCEGNKRSRLPDPLDCRSFFDCPGDSANPTVPRRGTCSPGLAYDAARVMCVLEAAVAACRPPAAAASSQAVAAPPPPPVCPIECTYPGVFPDPFECQRYVTCSPRKEQRGPWRPGDPLVRLVNYCPIFMYYNTYKGGCAIGFCGKV